MRVGVIGVGNMGKNHARVYSMIDGVDLVGVADISEEKAKVVASACGTEAFTDFRDLLKRDLDAASIAVPTSKHRDVAVVAADFGVHMLIEKPIADSLAAADEIIKAAERSDVKVMVGHIERFNPAVVKLNEVISRGEIGEILTMSSKRLGPFPPAIRDVGVILDLAVHDIDIISYLYGREVENVYVIAGNSFHMEEDYASIMLKYGENKAGIVETNWLTPRKIRTLFVVGTSGVAYLKYIEQELEIWKEESVIKENVARREPLMNEIESFLKCISSGKEPSPSAVEGKYVLAVAIASIISYREGREVEVRSIYDDKTDAKLNPLSSSAPLSLDR